MTMFKGNTAVMTDEELSAILRINGFTLQDSSPLLPVAEAARSARLTTKSKKKLKSLGVVSSSRTLQPTPPFGEALKILADLTLEILLLFGTKEGVYVTRIYSTEGFKDNSMVSYLRDEETRQNHIKYLLSPSDITDAIDSRINFSDVREAPHLSLEISPAECVTLLALLDHGRTADLESLLEREPFAESTFTEEDISNALLKGRMEGDTRWAVTVGEYLYPEFDFDISKLVLNKALERLQREEHIIERSNSEYKFTDDLWKMVRSTFPIMSFFAMKTVQEVSDTEYLTSNISAIRGLYSILVSEVVNGDNPVMLVNSLTSQKLMDIVFRITSQPEELLEKPILEEKRIKEGPPQPPPPPKRHCTYCGAKLRKRDTFCRQCGKEVAS